MDSHVAGQLTVRFAQALEVLGRRWHRRAELLGRAHGPVANDRQSAHDGAPDTGLVEVAQGGGEAVQRRRHAGASTTHRYGRLLTRVRGSIARRFDAVTQETLSWALSLLTHTTLLNAYLATTPGGINAVLVTAFAAGANTSLVFGIQGLRLVLMVLAAPPLVAWLLRRSTRPLAA